MESKVAKNTTNCRLFSISLLANSVAIKQVLQQQILASIVLSGSRLEVRDLPKYAEITLETIPVHRLSDNTGILYRSAIALKLASLWRLPALDIANQLANSMATLNQENANTGAGDGERERARETQLSSQTIEPIISSSPHPPLTSKATSQGYLGFSIEVMLSGWIHFRLSDRSLATWLQQLIEMLPLLSDLQDDASIGFQAKGVPGEGERKIKKANSSQLETTHQGQLTQRSKTAHSLFEVQYAHARCCSLLRLAHRQSLIQLSDPDLKTQNWHFVDPNPIPWLHDDQGMESELIRLRLGHPAERGLIEQVLDGIDQMTYPTPSNAIKLATHLSHAFEGFYSACRIWGEVKTETPKLAQARLGLVGVTQKLLRSLLQEQLAVTAPREL